MLLSVRPSACPYRGGPTAEQGLPPAPHTPVPLFLGAGPRASPGLPGVSVSGQHGLAGPQAGVPEESPPATQRAPRDVGAQIREEVPPALVQPQLPGDTSDQWAICTILNPTRPCCAGTAPRGLRSFSSVTGSV